MFDAILLGPFRIFLLFIAILIIHQIITRQPVSTYNLNYVVKRFALYCSGVLIMIFLLVQLNMYDVFSILLVLLTLLVFVYFRSKNPLNIVKGINAKRTSFLLSFFKFIERDISISKLFKNNKHYLVPKKINYVFLTALAVTSATFVSRYLFLNNDLYTLSDLWIKNLENVKAFNSGLWFESGMAIKGELAFINFYSKIANISEEMAIHSFGLIETFVLAVVLFWVIQKIQKSKFIAPMVAILFFAFFYKYLPININLIIAHNPLYLAFCFALPAMVFTLKPEIFLKSNNTFFVSLLVLYIGIGLTNLFVFFVVLPLFFIPVILFTINNKFRHTAQSLGAYFLGVFIIMGMYYLAAIKTMTSFKEFLISNLVLVNSYTHFPQLVLDLDKLIGIYAIIGWITTGCLFFLWLKNKQKWMPSLVFQLFLNGFILLKSLDSIWFDKDLFNQSLSILIVLLIGISIGVIVHLFKISIPKNTTARGVSLAIFFVALFGVSYVFNGFFKYDSKKTETLKSDVLNTYNSLSQDFLPYTFAVVNQDYGQSMSINEHHFINYGAFIDTYVQRDSLYQLIKEDKKLLREKPELILPQSVFVFIATNANPESKYDIETPDETAILVKEKIEILKGRGRNVKVFFQDNYLSVYQIINQENSSNLDDLIFNL